MIIGNGLLAKAFSDFENNEKILIFASGVSNSNETRRQEFEREEILLRKGLTTHKDKLIIYFSTCSVYEPSTNYREYTRHKLDMEKIVQKNSKMYCIFRLPQVVGNGGNKNTVLNFIFDAIKTGTEFKLWKNASRNFIDVNDIFTIVSQLLETNKDSVLINRVINIANTESIYIPDLVYKIEKFLNKKALFKIVNSGFSYNIPVPEINNLILSGTFRFHSNYLLYLFKKYYS